MMNTDENMSASADAASYNLADEINNLGQRCAEALNRIGIFRPDDLAQYSTSAELQQALEEKGEEIQFWRIEKYNWIGQAREILAQRGNNEHSSPQEEAEKPEKASSDRESRDPDAIFTVSFYLKRGEDGRSVLQTTKVYDEKNAGEEPPFEGSDTTSWVNWMFERAKLPPIAEPIPTETAVAAESVPAETKAAVPPESVASEAASIEISKVQLSEVGPSSGVPKKRLLAEVRFKLSGTEVETLTAAGAPFRTEVHTVDVESRVSDLVASGLSYLESDKFEYNSQQEFPIPELGRYELHTIVLLLPPNEMMVSCQGPTLNVVP
jgi:hypothetical protein